MKVLVVGLGSMGKRRIRLLQKFPEVELVVGCDSRKDRRSDIEKQFGIEACKDIESAIKNHEGIDSAFVCTSPLSHCIIINQLLNYGLNVFTEINLISDGYKSNIELARDKNVKLFLSSTFFYREEIKYIRSKIREKSKLNYVYHIGQYLPDWHPWENYNDFFVGEKKTNGCREIMAIELPWIIDTFGKVQGYHVISDNISDLKVMYKDNYMIQLVHENGNKGTLIVDIVSPKATRNLEVYGENIYYSWNGTPNTLEEFNFNSKKIEKVMLDEKVDHIEGYSSFVVENAYQGEIKEFIDVVNGRSVPIYSFEKDLDVLKLIDEIEES